MSENFLEEVTNILMLEIAQIQHAQASNDRNISMLIEQHATVAQVIQEILPADNPAHQAVQSMIVAFQGHDALNQRLEHVLYVLETLAQFMGSREKREDPGAWADFCQEISTRYSMMAERLLHCEFIHCGDGTPPPQDNNASAEGSIELF